MHIKSLDSFEESLCISGGIVEWEQTKNVSLKPAAEEEFYRKSF